MNRSLRFFDYEQCYNHYVRSFERDWLGRTRVEE